MKTLDDVLKNTSTDTDVIFDDLIESVLQSRRAVSPDPDIDYIHRQMILCQPALRNNMYRRLLAGELDHPEHCLFMSEYQNSSVRYFYDTTLPKALAAHDDPTWRRYVDHIIEEESLPRPHHVSFQEFMHLCGADVSLPGEPARTYGSALDSGYTAGLPYAAGYALGVEAEAGYQIALLKKAYHAVFPEHLGKTEWFDVHLQGQEDEHAEASTTLLHSVAKSPSELELAKCGFNQFFRDVHAFMEGVSRLIDQRRAAHK